MILCRDKPQIRACEAAQHVAHDSVNPRKCSSKLPCAAPGQLQRCPCVVTNVRAFQVVRRGVAFDQGCDQLIDLIKQHGRWVDPEPDEDGEQAMINEAHERKEHEPQLA